jgi:Ubiquinol-cytochrome C reductase hinge protein
LLYGTGFLLVDLIGGYCCETDSKREHLTNSAPYLIKPSTKSIAQAQGRARASDSRETANYKIQTPIELSPDPIDTSTYNTRTRLVAISLTRWGSPTSSPTSTRAWASQKRTLTHRPRTGMTTRRRRAAMTIRETRRREATRKKKEATKRAARRVEMKVEQRRKRKRRKSPKIRRPSWKRVSVPIQILVDTQLTLLAFLPTECVRSSQCAGYKHHYDECVERVTYQHEHPEEFKGHKEDCVEECTYETQNLFRSSIHRCLDFLLITLRPQSSTSNIAPPNALHLSSSSCSNRSSSTITRTASFCYKLQLVICSTSSHSARYLNPQRLYSHPTTLARIATTASVSIVYVP